MSRILTPDQLGTELDNIWAQIRALKTAPALNNSEVKEGFTVIRDSNNVRRVQLGKQDDGSYGVRIWDDAGNLILTQKWIAQYDSVKSKDNCDATHPLTMRFEVPAGLDHMVSARLSFHLDAVRMVTHNHVIATKILANAGAPTNTDEYGTFDSTGNQGLVILMSVIAGLSGTSTFYTDSIGAVGQVKAIIDGPTATGVTVKLDAVSVLAGPYNTDQTDLDLLSALGANPTAGLHTLTLTPGGLGSIEAILKLGYAVSPGVQ